MLYSVPDKEVAAMTPNIKRATVRLLPVAGLVLLIIGAATSAFHVWIGAVLMVACLLFSVALMQVWDMRRPNVR
jgi:hypothetical protein